MCIICKTSTEEGVLAANVFLSEYSMAQRRMKAAIKAMLEVKDHVSPEQARQYDRIHKRMKAILRDWNSIEHQREANLTNTSGGSDE